MSSRSSTLLIATVLSILLLCVLTTTFTTVVAQYNDERVIHHTINVKRAPHEFSEYETELPDEDVFKRGLVSQHTSIESIAAEHSRYCKFVINRRFLHDEDATPTEEEEGRITLGYVTPWNTHGYDASRLFHKKFSHLSPTWFKLKARVKLNEFNKDDSKKSKIILKIEGEQDVDSEWLADVKSYSSGVRVIPRVNVEFMTDLLALFPKNEKLQALAIRKIIDLIKRYQFDGIVLEMTDAWAIIRSRHSADKATSIQALNMWVNKLGDAIHELSPKHQLMLVVRPVFPNTPYFNHEDLMATHEHVDGYSLMTYDYAVSYSRHFDAKAATGAIGPLNWMRTVVEELLGNEKNPRLAKKILLGINFYGYSYKPQDPDTEERAKAIVGRQYIETLNEIREKKVPATLEWEQSTAEHRIVINPESDNPIVIYYPTLNSVNKRISLAEELGTSLSVWELGQGMPYFYDLL